MGQMMAVAFQRARKVTALSVGGGRLLSGYDDGTVGRWQLGRGSKLGSLEWVGDVRGVVGEVGCLAAGNGWAAACGSGDYTIAVWDTVAAATVAALTGHTDRVTALAAAGAQGGRRLVSASVDFTLRVWCAAANDDDDGGRSAWLCTRTVPTGAWA